MKKLKYIFLNLKNLSRQTNGRCDYLENFKSVDVQHADVELDVIFTDSDVDTLYEVVEYS